MPYVVHLEDPDSFFYYYCFILFFCKTNMFLINAISEEASFSFRPLCVPIFPNTKQSLPRFFGYRSVVYSLFRSSISPALPLPANFDLRPRFTSQCSHSIRLFPWAIPHPALISFTTLNFNTDLSAPFPPTPPTHPPPPCPAYRVPTRVRGRRGAAPGHIWRRRATRTLSSSGPGLFCLRWRGRRSVARQQQRVMYARRWSRASRRTPLLSEVNETLSGRGFLSKVNGRATGGGLHTHAKSEIECGLNIGNGIPGSASPNDR